MVVVGGCPFPWHRRHLSGRFAARPRGHSLASCQACRLLGKTPDPLVFVFVCACSRVCVCVCVHVRVLLIVCVRV